MPGTLIGNEKVPVSPVVAVACSAPFNVTVTPVKGRPIESVIVPEIVAVRASDTEPTASTDPGDPPPPPGSAPPLQPAAMAPATTNEKPP